MLSHEEGVGLPVAEAMACGCPVVAARRASLPEIVADGGVLVDPNNANEVATEVHSLVTDSERRAGLITAGLERSSAFRWKDAGEAYVGVYRRTGSWQDATSGLSNCTKSLLQFPQSKIAASGNPCLTIP